jgi:hypothetical protein
MTVEASRFPTLKQVFSGYFHEDFHAVHAAPDAALRAFLDDASEHERARFWKESARFLADTSTLEFSDVRALLERLGCRWVPASRDALTALLTRPERPTPEGR